MRVTFTKLPRGNSAWTAFPKNRRPITGGGGVSGNSVPHDLVQFIVEREIGHRHGFWGCIADGATFKSLERKGRRRTRPGREVINAHKADLDRAEGDANIHWFAWRTGQDTPLGPILDDMKHRWLALAEGEELDLVFTPVLARRR